MDKFLESLPPEVAATLKEMEAARDERRKALLALTERVRHLSTVPRATAWLQHVAERCSEWGDEEAVTYLATAGHNVDSASRRLRDQWQSAQEDAIQQCAEGMGSTLNVDTGESTRIGGMPLHEAQRIRSLPAFRLRNFWGGGRHQEMHIDAAMLRAAHACDIGGFQDWWLRLADDATEEAITGAVDPVPASYWLFSMVRSPLARDLMPKALERTLEKISVKTQKDEPGPWRVWWGGPRPEDREAPLIATHHGFAANLAFASAILDEHPSEIANGAAAELLRGQHGDGWWSPWAHHAQPSVDTTARALLAIAHLRPMGHKRALSSGIEFLRQAQRDSGYWFDRGQPDSVFLTVVTLDAISAPVEAGTESRPPGELKSHFKVALSFPGDARDQVEKLATLLASRLPKGSLFYDNHYKAHLSRPNLDTFLIDIYRNRSKLIVVFVGESYQGREWCGLEWRAIRDLIKARADQQVMFVRVDDGPVDGLLTIDGYVDLRATSPEELADLVLQRLKTLDAS